METLDAVRSVVENIPGICQLKPEQEECLVHILNRGAQKNEQTIYAEVDENIKPQKSQEMLQKSENPETVYDTAGDPGKTDVTIHTTPNDDPMNQTSSLTERSKPDAAVTIYCAIQQQPNPPKTEAENTIYAVVNIQPAGYESAHPQPE